MLMSMIDTSDVSKNNNLESHSLVPVKCSSVKLSYRLLGILAIYIRSKM